MKTKLLSSLCVAVLLLASMSITAFASSPSDEAAPNTLEITVESANGESRVTVIDLSNTSMYEELEDGTIVIPIRPRWNMTSHTISSGSTMWYYTSGGSGFSLNRGQKVTLKASFDKSIGYECGYSGAGYTSIMKSGTGSSISTSANMPADGSYSFYIKNSSSSTVTVNSGSITY